MPSVMVRKAFASSTVSQILAASSSRGSKPWIRAERPPQLGLARLVVGHGARRDQQAVDRVRQRRRLVREVLQDRAERQEHLADVAPVVARVLLLVRHHAHDRVGEVADADRLPHRRPAAEELLLRVAAEEAPRAAPPSRRPSRGSGPRPPGSADPGELGQRARDREHAAVVGAAHGGALPELGHHVAARRGLRLDLLVVGRRPLDRAVRRAARRPAGWCGRRRRSSRPCRTLGPPWPGPRAGPRPRPPSA